MTDSLADSFLEQSPASNWIIDRRLIFRRVFGDPEPILGRTADELVGRSVSEAFDPESARAWKERIERVLQGETLSLRDRRGSIAWSISLFPIVEDGNICYVAASARELTPWSRAEQELRHTVLGALKAMEFERKSASRFLHDSVGQNLTAIGLQLDLMRMDLETLAPDVCERIAEIQKMLEVMMEEVREYSYELNPSTVERAGLRTALDRLAVRIRERFTGSLRINVDPSLKIDPGIASAIYQIAHEAVENAIQHSSCSLIEIAVKSTRSGGFLEIRDNGKGFDPADLQGNYRGLGLLSMEHYAAQAGLDLSIASNRDTGTTVRAMSPDSA
jgi:two-component system, NarL family, sensor histidine kinase NreB